LADELRQVRFSAIYSSDLERSRRTAEIIARGRGLRVRQYKHLREINAGLWEGLCDEEVKERYPREYAERERDPIGFRFPGGESYRDLQKEILPVFLRMIERATGNILVVAHKGVNRVLLIHLSGRPLEELYSIPQDYGCVNLIRVSIRPDGARAIKVVTAGES
jgi:alpha-ribazole phosphatase